MNHNDTKEVGRWLSTRRAAAYADVSVTKLNELVSLGKLPAYRLAGGTHRRFLTEDLDALMQAETTNM
jgi:excisionase family DNA binding protein